MRDSRIEELISAYVDGELSSDERLLVERELQQSSDSRQLLEQLRLQRRMLQSLPRVRLAKDFSDSIVQRLEESKVAQPAVETRESRKTSIRRQSLNVLLGIASVVAAGLLMSLALRDNKVEKNPLQPPQTDFVEKPNVEPEIRLAAFRKKFGHLLVYELTVTPKGRQNNVIGQWFKAANINVAKNELPIEGKLEKGLLESRYFATDLVPVIGGEKDVANADVEMILIRDKAHVIDELLLQWYKVRGAANNEATMQLDLAITTKELEIFLHLNDAADGGGTVRQVSSDTWTTPGAYRLKFRYAFNKKSTPRVTETSAPRNKSASPVGDAGSSRTPPVKLAQNADEKSKQAVIVQPDIQRPLPANANPGANDGNVPCQVLVIIRQLNENHTFPAVTGRNGK